MKKLLPLLLCTLLLFACADAAETKKISGSTQTVSDILNATADPETVIPTDAELAAAQDGSDGLPFAASTDAEIDLTTLSSTMVYSYVYDMVTNPEDYLGKTVKMQGLFSLYEAETRNYYACVIQDATACCASGIEFVPSNAYPYPAAFPAPGEKITVVGTFHVYEETGTYYCELIDATIG